MNRLTGIHAVREALEANRPLDSLIVAKGSHGNRIEELVRLARKQDVPVRFEERIQLDRTAGTREHQGVVAFVAASPTASFEDLLKPRDSNGAPGLVVLLDGVEDPQNLGAIVRTSLAAGASGVVIPERRAAGLTDTVARASAGALAHLPVARVKNLARAMEELKEAGYWLVGLDERAEQRAALSAQPHGHAGFPHGRARRERQAEPLPGDGQSAAPADAACAIERHRAGLPAD